MNKMICRICDLPIVHSKKKDFQETGALFRHAAVGRLRDSSEMCDVEGSHGAEPKVINHDNNTAEVWGCSSMSIAKADHYLVRDVMWKPGQVS